MEGSNQVALAIIGLISAVLVASVAYWGPMIFQTHSNIPNTTPTTTTIPTTTIPTTTTVPTTTILPTTTPINIPTTPTTTIPINIPTTTILPTTTPINIPTTPTTTPINIPTTPTTTIPTTTQILTIKSGQVRLHSDGGWAIYNKTVSGLTPGTTVIVAIEGWGITSDYMRDRTIAIYLWDIAANYWATEFPVLNDGTIQVRFIGVYSDTHPFDMTINYAVIGNART